MKPPKRPKTAMPGVVTDEDVRAFTEYDSKLPTQPLRPAGSKEECPDCGGVLLTTNELIHTVATPKGLVVLGNLPGAECRSCGLKEFDGAASSIMARYEIHEIAADYETRITRTGGRTLGTYFKADLVRVLGLKGKEKLRWKVIDRNHAYVEVARG